MNRKNWIRSPKETTAAAVGFRKTVTYRKPLKAATLSVSAIGLYAPYLNGRRIGKNVLAPGWTSYSHRVQYQTYDVTDLLPSGSVLEIDVGQGWAVGYIGFGKKNHYTSDHTSLNAELTLHYADGTKDVIVTDPTWDVYTTSVLSSEIYHGETVDLTVKPAFLGKAISDRTVRAKLIPQVGADIIENERLAPVEIIRTPKGETVIDFGQNMTGYVEIRVKGRRGDRIVLHHAEVLDRDGNFYIENLRAARNENIYVLSGGEDVFKPTFGFQGFRYVELVECPAELVKAENFRAVVVHSEMKRTGFFRCGESRVNQLYHNVIWGQKSNYLDIPTDCPQRDERLGWTGDAQIFCRTAAINFDVSRFFRKWLGDVALEQGADGAIYGVVPNEEAGRPLTRVSAAWGDVACVAPWEMYLAYGDKKELEKNLPMMQKWVEYMHHAGPEEFLWLGGYHYGDWLAMDAGEDSYVGATSNDLIASAFFAYSTSLFIKAGEVLGKDMTEYRALYENVRRTFRSYFMENGMPKEEFPFTEVTVGKKPRDTVRRGVTQTAIVLILQFDLCTEEERPALADKLEELIHASGDLMQTGFVGTPYLLRVLSRHGKDKLAYQVLLENRTPSWLYSVEHGATTMWEHWNSIKEDGTFWSTSMNSFNHYAYGSVYDWIFNVAVGISPRGDAPGYRGIDLAPHPDKRLGFVNAGIETAQGTIRSAWYYKGNDVYYEFDIPKGTVAYLTLPNGYRETLPAGSYRFATR